MQSTKLGCFIQLWKDRNFQGATLIVRGPGEFPKLGAENDWSNHAGSLRVGPHAFVLAYAKKSFKGRVLGLLPAQEIADLRDYRFNDEIDSLRVIDSLRIFDKPPLEDIRSLDPVAQLTTPVQVNKTKPGRRRKKNRK
jgi:hypothetical protein